MVNRIHQETDNRSGYGALLRSGSFQCFLWTQFLGAFNDNVYKMIVSVAAVESVADQQLGARYLSLAGAVFVLPFLLFAGHAGQLADRFSKTRVLQITKSFEILIMVVGCFALVQHNFALLLVVLFMLALQANFFSPAKYGVLPEMMSAGPLTRANGLIELSTFAAIVLGTSVGTLLFAQWRSEPIKMGLTLLAIAIVGSLMSLGIRYVPASGSQEPFHWNPFQEIWVGTKSLYRKRSLWLSVLGISYFWFAGALLQMAVILLGKESLHTSDIRVGLLATALASGIGLGSIAAGWFSPKGTELGLVPTGAALLGACAVLLGFVHSFGWATAILSGIGFAGGLFIVPLNAYLQEKAAPEEKGRLLATNNFINMLGVIAASGVLSLLHDKLHWEPTRILPALGILTLFVAAYSFYLIPAYLLRFILRCVIHSAFRIRTVGAEHIPASGGALIASNHVSFADAVLVSVPTHRIVRFLMWEPYFKIKLFKPFFQILGAIPIAAGSPKKSLLTLRTAREELKRGSLVGIFPEGGITRTSEIMPFQRGIEMILDRTDAPVIPVYLHGLWGHPLSMKGGRVFGSPLFPLRRTVTIYVGEPMPGEVSADSLYQRILQLEAAAEGTTPASTNTGMLVRF